MSAYVVASIILWGMVLVVVLVMWAWITVEVIEWARDLRHNK